MFVFLLSIIVTDLLLVQDGLLAAIVPKTSLRWIFQQGPLENNSKYGHLPLQVCRCESQ